MTTKKNEKIREALQNLVVWAGWMRKRYRTPEMGQPNTGAYLDAVTALAPPDEPAPRRMSNAELWINLRMALMERRPPSSHFSWTADLPDPAAMPYETVTIVRDQLLRFRSDFAELAAFVCVVVGKPFETMCKADLIFYAGEMFAAERAKERAPAAPATTRLTAADIESAWVKREQERAAPTTGGAATECASCVGLREELSAAVALANRLMAADAFRDDSQAPIYRREDCPTLTTSASPGASNSIRPDSVSYGGASPGESTNPFALSREEIGEPRALTATEVLRRASPGESAAPACRECGGEGWSWLNPEPNPNLRGALQAGTCLECGGTGRVGGAT